MKKLFGSLIVLSLLAASISQVLADSLSIDIESPSYTIGNINGQNGWSKTGPYDVAVDNIATFPNAVSFGFGNQSLRLSNAITSGSFGDQTFTPGLSNPAGENTPYKHYEASFDIGSTQANQQPGLFLSVSPDDGNGSRMSYVGFDDQADGIHVIFYDVTDPGPKPTQATFNPYDVATIDRTSAHKIRFVIDFIPGPANDIVKLYLDSVLVHTGTTWEDYYRYDPEQTGNGNIVPAISKLLFREGGNPVPANSGQGYLVDAVDIMSQMYPRSAEIISPTGSEIPQGMVNFEAYLDDDDIDPIQWAVRKGTCAAGTNTVFGNVDGLHNTATINISDLSNQTFYFTGDMSSMDPGMYCFIYNPTEDSEEEGIRLTKEFELIILDTDEDGVPDSQDLCLNTVSDVTDGLGTNRWMWTEGEGWITNSPINKKGKVGGPNIGFTIEDTYGCSCTQIIESMRTTIGDEFNGHEKFMCSKSLIEDWIDGKYHLETIEVPASTMEGVNSSKSYQMGDYILAASGTWQNKFNTSDVFDVDADYVSYDNWANYQNGPTGYPNRLDLQVDNNFVDWGTYDNIHKYMMEYSLGSEGPLSFRIFDGYPATNTPVLSWYNDNYGSLNVEVYAKLW